MANQTANYCLITLLFVLFSAIAYAVPHDENNKTAAFKCDENGDCPSSSTDCHEICGCDRAIQYNETTKTCVVSFRHLMIAEIKIYDSQDKDSEDGGTIAGGGTMSNKIRLESEKIFNSIMISVILFITCCAVCVVAACCYCCRISYSDYALKKDVKALANKLNRDGKLRKISRKQPQTQANQSCNIVCEDAGVFVV
ncbi:uncharacterized protein LOC135081196 isoform X2 [Ostrinia nubilalis]|uniref:uncharacterized protein LOC114353937 isoform X2 n=1 Tax=Ostrinia furnacalis TaxID=93504 RepID=UPI0010408EB0|nr:uncharacterized protein LOC114353937 isoform X2 [Ostrinia furnacalis]